MDDLLLNDGRAMPRLGMGTWQVPDSQAAMLVRAGLDLGFRLVDTAAAYGNERGVGEGLRSETPWITTKLWNSRHGDAAAALDESLALLGLDAVDLYLIHWPVSAAGLMEEAWRALIAARDAGKARSIGVSNFRVENLKAVAAATGVVPAVNQIELHPYFQQRELVAYHAEHGIVTQSWSPLGRGSDLLGEEAVAAIADRLGRSPAQIVIAWHLAKGFAVIPKAADRDHLADNAAAGEVTLTAEDVAALDALDRADGRLGPTPESM